MIVDMLAGRADPSPGNPLQQLRLVHLDRHRDQRRRLRSRCASSQSPAPASAETHPECTRDGYPAATTGRDHVVHQVIGHQLPLIHQCLRGLSQLRPARWSAECRRSRSAESQTPPSESAPACPCRRPGRPKEAPALAESCSVCSGSVIALDVRSTSTTDRGSVDSLPAPAAANPAGLGREAIIVTHDQLRFDLLHRIHRHAHHDQQRRAAEVEVDAQTVGRPRRQPVEDAQSAEGD